jgi:hypothetical protein
MNSVTAGAEGQSYVVSLQQMGIASHFTGGIAAMSGTFPLPSGAQDTFNRTMGLVSYSTTPKYSLIAMALIGHDNNPNDGASRASGSNGWSFEGIYTPLNWLHLDARYERTNDGLGMIQNNYVGDIAFSIMPNLVVTLENVSSVGSRPVMSYQVLWAGPWVCCKLRGVSRSKRRGRRRAESPRNRRAQVVGSNNRLHREPFRRHAQALPGNAHRGAGSGRRDLHQSDLPMNAADSEFESMLYVADRRPQ